MADDKTCSDEPLKAVKSNVVHLFSGGARPESMPDDLSNTEEVRELMTSPLLAIIDQVKSGDVNGIIVITLKSDSRHGGEFYAGGAGVWGQLDRAVGLLAMVNSDLISEAKREDPSDG